LIPDLVIVDASTAVRVGHASTIGLCSSRLSVHDRTWNPSRNARAIASVLKAFA
jgi:hypothetical protein